MSIKDIAQEAGVSPSTVSRALHNHPQISTETGERVQRLAQEMGYTPSLLARSLVTQDTATIGLVITYTADPFLSRLVQGVEETARNNGYSVFLSSSYRNYERELEAERAVARAVREVRGERPRARKARPAAPRLTKKERAKKKAAAARAKRRARILAKFR